MNILIKDSEHEFDRAAADEVVRQVKEKPDSVMCIATGKTPLGMYGQLAARNQNNDIDFSQAKFVSLDEYFGVDITSSGTTSTCLEKNLYSHINVQREHIYKFNSNPASRDDEIHRYDALVDALGGIDLIVLGIGANGHIGFNEPGAEFASTTNIRRLTRTTMESNNRFTAGVMQPEYGITMGIKTIMNARSIVLLAKGSDKSDILYEAIHGRITEAIPSTVLQLHPFLTVIVDKEAACKLSTP